MGHIFGHVFGRVFIVGLGTNLGERQQNLTRAVEAVARLPVHIEALSRVYESAPLGPPQPDYLNAGLRLTSELAPETMLAALLDIERMLGRVRDVRWGPRVLDLDVLWSSEPWSSAQLTVPHPELARRTFALAPLLDVAPELAPQYGAALAALGGAPTVYGALSFDRVSSTCAFAESAAL
ncbi:MAG: 2-amino-4-hydroxy-6-hydroxymethyldihydropteridine diphosphokinase [Polyangiales bacterium]